MRNRFFYLIFLIILSLILTSCADDNHSQLEDEIREKDRKISEFEDKIQELEADNDTTENLLARVIQAMELIKDKDFESLSEYIHPEKGVRFTPYFFVDVEEDRVFTADQVADLMGDEEIYHWGYYDGTGDPIELKFSDYYNRFVYDQDFANPQIIGNNVPIGQGNTIDNVTEAYPDGHFIEFHFKQIDSQYEGMDWESLRLVFEQHNGTWYLVGIIHGQWTI